RWPRISARPAPTPPRAHPVLAALRHRFVGIDTPDIGALHPTRDIDGFDAAPGVAAFEQLGHDPRLGARDQPRAEVGVAAHGPPPAADHHLALAGQHVLLHPALGAVRVADAPPVLELGDDLDRQVLADKNPFDRVALPRAGAQVDLV